jgi:hypothetical protein
LLLDATIVGHKRKRRMTMYWVICGRKVIGKYADRTQAELHASRVEGAWVSAGRVMADTLECKDRGKMLIELVKERKRLGY